MSAEVIAVKFISLFRGHFLARLLHHLQGVRIKTVCPTEIGEIPSDGGTAWKGKNFSVSDMLVQCWAFNAHQHTLTRPFDGIPSP